MMRLYINFNPHIKYPHQRGPRSFGDTSYLSIRRFIDPINTYSSAPMLIYNHTIATCPVHYVISREIFGEYENYTFLESSLYKQSENNVAICPESYMVAILQNGCRETGFRQYLSLQIP